MEGHDRDRICADDHGDDDNTMNQSSNIGYERHSGKISTQEQQFTGVDSVLE